QGRGRGARWTPRHRATTRTFGNSQTRKGESGASTVPHPDGYNPLVAQRSVRLSSPERVLFPDDGITKRDVFDYYRAIAPVLVPHLRSRPFTMKRFPYGATGD